MAIGKEVASYSVKSTSMEKTVDAAGNHSFTMNFEGSCSGEWKGAVLSTMVGTTHDFKSGTYTVNAAVYLEDGVVVTGRGSGVFRSVGKHQWQLNGTDIVSDGSCFASEGTLALAERSLNGKIFELK